MSPIYNLFQARRLKLVLPSVINMNFLWEGVQEWCTFISPIGTLEMAVDWGHVICASNSFSLAGDLLVKIFKNLNMIPLKN